MKTPLDPRHKKREAIVKLLYAFSYRPNQPTKALIKPIVENLKEINKIISQAAPEWPIEKLNKIDLAILRLAVYELTIQKENPAKVIIDEAIELAKQYGGENSSKFINGSLGAVLKNIKREKNPQSKIKNRDKSGASSAKKGKKNAK